LLQTAADDDQAELDLMAYNDAIADVFYTNRLLNNTVQTSQPHQQGVGAGSGQPAFINYGNIEYRHRWWTLDAIDYHAFVMK
jgi:Flp pilus assembly protein TadG